MRIEGYLPKEEFAAQLQNGLARIAFTQKQWAEAQRRYNEVVERYPNTAAAPEAMYWRGVSKYKATNDHNSLGDVAQQMQKYPGSIWAEKASVWAAH